MEVIGYKDEPKMPPDGKLPDADAQILREWIRRGVAFPVESGGPGDRPAQQSGRNRTREKNALVAAAGDVAGSPLGEES